MEITKHPKAEDILTNGDSKEADGAAKWRP